MRNRKFYLLDHIKEHTTIYIFMTILFLTGIIFGAIIVNSMHFVQKQDLFFYIERYFEQIADVQQVENKTLLISSYFYHVKYLLLLLVLGLSVIGLPIVWILIFLKGLVVGFSVGFIVNQLGMKGLFLASLSIAPQNILIIPIYIIAGSLSMVFSLTLLNKLFSRGIAEPILNPLRHYITVFSVLFIVSIIPAILEVFIAHETMQSFIKSFL